MKILLITILLCSHYGAQAVVVSIDPKRVYVSGPALIPSNLNEKTIVKLLDNDKGRNGEEYCWWQVTVKGGRETRDMDAIQLAKVLSVYISVVLFLFLMCDNNVCVV